MFRESGLLEASILVNIVHNGTLCFTSCVSGALVVVLEEFDPTQGYQESPYFPVKLTGKG